MRIVLLFLVLLQWSQSQNARADYAGYGNYFTKTVDNTFIRSKYSYEKQLLSISKYTKDGRLDETFGVNGSKDFGLEIPGPVAHEVRWGLGRDHFLVAMIDRWLLFTTEAELNRNFGEGGVFSKKDLDLPEIVEGGFYHQPKIVIDSKRRIIFAVTKVREAGRSEFNYYLSKHDFKGRLIRDFGSDGYSLLDLPEDSAFGASILGNGQLLITGKTDNQIIKVDNNLGTVVWTKAYPDTYAFGKAVLERDGKVLMMTAKQRGLEGWFFQFFWIGSDDGKIDMSYGSNGLATIAEPFTQRHYAVDKNGSIFFLASPDFRGTEFRLKGFDSEGRVIQELSRGTSSFTIDCGNKQIDGDYTYEPVEADNITRQVVYCGGVPSIVIALEKTTGKIVSRFGRGGVL